ncbi:hypothetical protein PO124_11295 [Bacillus licheniformis]|nr:hypothetical protein [Bacillus licheniformis]
MKEKTAKSGASDAQSSDKCGNVLASYLKKRNKPTSRLFKQQSAARPE